MTPRPLVLAGAGGFARETVELVAAINAALPQWDLRGLLDDEPGMHGREVGGVPVLGPIDSVADSEVAVVLCVGNPSNFTSRARIAARLNLPADRYATLIHPTAVIPKSVPIGPGTVIHAMTVATGWSTIGAHVAVMPATVITHDDIIRDFVTIAAGVRIAGTVTIDTGAYLGAGALIRENISIGAWSLIGMGSVVTRPVPSGEVWAGNPARYHGPSSQNIDFLTPSIPRNSVDRNMSETEREHPEYSPR